MYKVVLIITVVLLSNTWCLGQREFWGTSANGGEFGNGFIFKTDSIGDSLQIVHSFSSAVDGENIGALLLASNHRLYGLAASGGTGATNVFTGGTFFEYDLSTNVFKVLEHFGLNNANLPGVYLPRGDGLPGLTEVSPGILWGLMRQGQYVFSYNIATGIFTQPFVVPTFQGGATNSTQQNYLNQAFIKGPDGLFYVSTATNSSCPTASPSMGSIIRVNPANNALAIRHRSACTIGEGYIYKGFLAQRSSKFYGATLYGGANNKGVIFEYDPVANTYTKRHEFSGSVYEYDPTALVFGANGKLYGTSHGGGIPEPNLGLNAGGGTLFELDLSTNSFAKKHDFTFTGQSIEDMGIFPSGLISASNGKLYGATQFGVFEYDPTTEMIRKAGRFGGLGFAPSLLEVCRKPFYGIPTNTIQSVCKDSILAIDLGSSNTVAASWTHDGIVDNTRTKPVLTFDAFSAEHAGTWICTLSNACGVTVTTPIQLQVEETARPVVMADGPLDICDGQVVTLSAPEGHTSYKWSNGETSGAITVVESGEYSVTVTDQCESQPSASHAVVVHNLPLPPTAIEVMNANTLKVIGESDEYVWMLDGESLSTTTAELLVTESGEYTVYAINEAGCQSMDFASLIYNIASAEGDTNNAWKIYPVPTSDMINIQVNEPVYGSAVIKILDARAVTLIEKNVTIGAAGFILNVESLPSGLYQLIISHKSTIVSKRIIVH